MREKRRERETFLLFRVMGYLGIFLSGHAWSLPWVSQSGGGVLCPTSLSLSLQMTSRVLQVQGKLSLTDRLNMLASCEDELCLLSFGFEP